MDLVTKYFLKPLKLSNLMYDSLLVDEIFLIDSKEGSFDIAVKVGLI